MIEGSFGEVRLVVHRETKSKRAMKVMRKYRMEDDERRLLFNEINILKGLVSASSTKLCRITRTS